MVDLTSIAAVTSSLKAAGEIAQAAVGLSQAEAIREKVLDMQTKIGSALGDAVAAYTEQLALLERVRGLESKIADFEAWSAKAERYELHKWESGSFTYRLKEGVQPSEPAHHACPKCFEERKRFVMNQADDMYKHRLKCPNCALVVVIGSHDRLAQGLEQMRRRGF